MSFTNISIIIATRNREQILWETVEKACEAINNTNAELIVVNDSDYEIVVPIIFSEKIKCFNNPKNGVSSARNFGAQNAKGKILFFIDDDMWINRKVIEWINSYSLNAADRENVYNINWEYPPSINEKLFSSKIGKYILTHGYNTMWGRMHQKNEKPTSGLYLSKIVGSGSLVMSKEIFNKLGGYNEAMIFQGEDIDLSNKLNAHKIPIYCVFDVTLNHNHQDRLEIDSFLKRNSDGFESEFNAVKSGLIEPLSDIKYHGIKKQMFNFFSFTEKGWLLLLKIIPNQSFFISINNKLIGYLESLQRYKQWRNIFG